MKTKRNSFTPLADVEYELRQLIWNVRSAFHWLQCAEEALRVSIDKLDKGIGYLPEHIRTMKWSDLVLASEKKPTEAED